MAKGIFPPMSIPDIIGALAGWGLSVSHEQLVRPSPDFVEGVYCACLQQVTDLTHESLRDPVQNALAVAEVDKVCRSPLYCPWSYLQLLRTYMLPPWSTTSFFTTCMHNDNIPCIPSQPISAVAPGSLEPPRSKTSTPRTYRTLNANAP